MSGWLRGGLPLLGCLAVALTVGGCNGSVVSAIEPALTTAKSEEAQPTGRSMVGKPYQVGGRWYTPKEEPDYNKTGKASWYGKKFHGRRTANGERFNMHAMTAAHPTLPLPSFVRVTVDSTGKSAVLRVNDRGPFHRGRIIDVSRAAAEKLGFKRAGSAKVRVEYLGPAPVGGSEKDTRLAAKQFGETPKEKRGWFGFGGKAKNDADGKQSRERRVAETKPDDEVEIRLAAAAPAENADTNAPTAGADATAVRPATASLAALEPSRSEPAEPGATNLPGVRVPANERAQSELTSVAAASYGGTDGASSAYARPPLEPDAGAINALIAVEGEPEPVAPPEPLPEGAEARSGDRVMGAHDMFGPES